MAADRASWPEYLPADMLRKCRDLDKANFTVLDHFVGKVLPAPVPQLLCFPKLTLQMSKTAQAGHSK